MNEGSSNIIPHRTKWNEEIDGEGEGGGGEIYYVRQDAMQCSAEESSLINFTLHADSFEIPVTDIMRNFLYCLKSKCSGVWYVFFRDIKWKIKLMIIIEHDDNTKWIQNVIRYSSS